MAATAILDFRISKILLADSAWGAQSHHCANFFFKIGLSFVEIMWFFFKFLRWPLSSIFEIAKFYLPMGSRGSRRISMPNFIIIGQSVAKISSFFSRWWLSLSWFSNLKILWADGVWRIQSHHCAKFCHGQFSHCEDIAIFQDGRCHHLRFLLADGVQRLRRISMPNFVKIGQLVAKILRFFEFLRWWPSVILDLFWAYLDHQHRVIGGLYHSAKFCYDRCSSFDNMIVLIFGTLGWKTTIHAPRIGGFVLFDPLNGLQYQRKPKKAHPYMSLHHFSHQAWKSSERSDV